jgi:hypothetical protein
MTQRVLVISIEESKDGSKRTAQRKFPADSFGALPVAPAGEGFLTIIGQLMRELDGTPTPASANTGPVSTPEPPAPKPGAFAPGKKFGGVKGGGTKPYHFKKNPVDKPKEPVV